MRLGEAYELASRLRGRAASLREIAQRYSCRDDVGATLLRFADADLHRAEKLLAAVVLADENGDRVIPDEGGR